MLDDGTVWNLQTVNPGVIEYTPRYGGEDASADQVPYPDLDDPGDLPVPPATEDEDDGPEALALNEHPEDVRDEAGEPPRDDDEEEADEDGAA